MLLQILLLVASFALLIKGADVFVDGASSMAQNFKVPKILIGLTIVAFGTSAPEFAVSLKALASGSSDMVLGNVIGSNIMNILLILGVAAIIRPIVVHRPTVIKELPLCLLTTVLLAVLLADTFLGSGDTDYFSRADAIVVLLFFAVFVYYLVKTAISRRGEEEEKPEHNLLMSTVLLLAGLGGIIFGSNYVVESASSLATMIGVSERVISLTIIAFGTSLPELVTTIIASKKGEQDLLVGNIIGSNIFNIAVVLGIPSVIYGGVAVAGFSALDVLTFIASALILFLFSFRNHRIDRYEGALMLVVFFVYYGLVVAL